MKNYETKQLGWGYILYEYTIQCLYNVQFIYGVHKILNKQINN